MKRYCTVVVVCFLFSFGTGYVSEYELFINPSARTGELIHFWKSTGFCPPEPHQDANKFDLASDLVQNLAFIGAIPQKGIKQVRIHWLLDLIKVTGIKLGRLELNMTNLDNLMDLLYQNGLQPGFEIMGNPSNHFTDFDNKTQMYNWRTMIFDIVSHLADEYGVGELSDWNFETWNEPDCHDFDGLKISPQGFLTYYDACEDALKALDPTLKIGGPGDGCRSTEYADTFLDHIATGRNFFTGQPLRTDFLSFHRKGDGQSSIILQEEMSVGEMINNKYPTLSKLPFYNDEADPLVGWSRDEEWRADARYAAMVAKVRRFSYLTEDFIVVGGMGRVGWSRDEEWRADARYAAMVAKVIVQHQNLVISNPDSAIRNYTLLSNDNAFLSWYPHQFTQRTLLARFQINNTKPVHTQFIRKPVYAVMGLLALMGEEQVQATLTTSDGEPVKNTSNLGVLASLHVPELSTTADSWQVSILLYSSNDTGVPTEQGTIYMSIDLPKVPPAGTADYVMASYVINNVAGNPYTSWVKYGKPAYPTVEQLQNLRNEEGPVLFNLRTVPPGETTLGVLKFYQPQVTLHHICAKPLIEPDQANGLNIYNITGGQVLITWSDSCVNSRCLLTFEVEFTRPGRVYERINTQNTIVTSFVYVPLSDTGVPSEELVRGYYRVRAVDYWNRPGEYSLPQQYPSQE